MSMVVWHILNYCSRTIFVYVFIILEWLTDVNLAIIDLLSSFYIFKRMVNIAAFITFDTKYSNI